MIMMIVDVSECDITYATDIDPDTTSSYSIITPTRHVTKEKWTVLFSNEAPKTNHDELIYYHFDSNLTTLIKLHDNKDIWIVPLKSLVGS